MGLPAAVVFLSFSPLLNAAITANLVINGDMESGDLTGWSTSNGMEVIDDPGAVSRGTNGLSPGKTVGRFSFTGGTGPSIATALQTVPLASFASAIDSGTQGFAIGVDLQSRLFSAADTASAFFRFQDAGGNLLGSELSFADPPTGNFDWTEFSQSGIVPVGTRQLEIEVDSRRSGFNSSDGFIDNVSFKLVPEPSTPILGFFSSLLLLRRTRR